MSKILEAAPDTTKFPPKPAVEPARKHLIVVPKVPDTFKKADNEGKKLK